MTKEQVAKVEQRFSFASFTNEDAYHLAEMIIHDVRAKHKKSVGIRVVLHDVVVYQYLMDGKKDDVWLIRKQHTVEQFHHSSYYVYVENQETLQHEHLKQEKYFAICGGGFPIIIRNKMVGSFCVSGLPHDEDHHVIVEAFESLRKEQEHEFTN